MAALNIAFEAPDNAGGIAPSGARPVDLEHLARQTMGDKALGLEVLQMFARQARESMRELAAAEGAARGAVAHRLKGSAQSVGAGGVARAAAALEEIRPMPSPCRPSQPPWSRRKTSSSSSAADRRIPPPGGWRGGQSRWRARTCTRATARAMLTGEGICWKRPPKTGGSRTFRRPAIRPFGQP